MALLLGNDLSHKLDFLIIIQARLNSTRLPNKVMQMVGDRTMLRRVWDAAKEAQKKMVWSSKVIVAWPERYPDLDEKNVLERFKRLSTEFPSRWIIRLTSDCPLLTGNDILSCEWTNPYWANHKDGHDVQIFDSNYLWDSLRTSTEHVIADFTTLSTGLSVNTKEDLERVRHLAR